MLSRRLRMQVQATLPMAQLRMASRRCITATVVEAPADNLKATSVAVDAEMDAAEVAPAAMVRVADEAEEISVAVVAGKAANKTLLAQGWHCF